MLTIDEFNHAISNHKRRLASLMAIPIAIILFGYLLYAFKHDALVDWLVRMFDVEIALLILDFALVVSVVPAFIFLWFLMRRARYNAALCCPACGKVLTSQQEIVVATRHCGFCGGRVLSE